MPLWGSASRTIQLSGLPVDRQVSEDGLRRQLNVACQGCLGRGSDGADDSDTHPLDSLPDLSEVTLKALFVVAH